MTWHFLNIPLLRMRCGIGKACQELNSRPVFFAARKDGIPAANKEGLIVSGADRDRREFGVCNVKQRT